MNHDKVLKILKGLNTFSLDDIAIITGLEETELLPLLSEYLSDGTISKLSESEYRYINKIPSYRGMLRLIEKPQSNYSINENINFIEAVEYFLMYYASQNCTPSTFKTYKSSFKCHLIPFFKTVKLAEITREDIKRFMDFKFSENLTPKNIRNCVTLLGTMLNKYLEWGVIKTSPYSGLISIRTKKKELIRVLTEWEIKSIIKLAKRKKPILAHFIDIAVSTGLKRSEISALKKEDFDFCNNTINIDKTLYQGKIIPSKVKTSIRQVDMPQNIASNLKKIINEKNENDFIFYSMSQSFYTQDKRLRKTFSDILKKLKLEELKFNDLRHTYSYNVLQQGMSIDYLNKQLGEYSIQATMDKYRDFIK